MKRVYEKLILLYPAQYLERHRDELLQNFDDLDRDNPSQHFFLAFIISDLFKSLGGEYMQYIRTHRWAQLTLAVIIALFALSVWQFFELNWAHSSFANYADFRGCQTITSESDNAGTCTLASGQSIKMVQFHGGWYLDGDLPVCIGNICF